MSQKQARRERQNMRREGKLPTCDRKVMREQALIQAQADREEALRLEAERVAALPEEEREALLAERERIRWEKARKTGQFLRMMGAMAASLPQIPMPAPKYRAPSKSR